MSDKPAKEPRDLLDLHLDQHYLFRMDDCPYCEEDQAIAETRGKGIDEP